MRDEDHPQSAEFAIGVGDRWQRLGLGKALLTALADCARNAGIAEITGTINAENNAIKGLVEAVLGPFRLRSAGDGTAEIVVDVRARDESGGVTRS